VKAGDEEDQSYKCHRLILASKSNYFYKRLVSEASS
jgi:hypothetical protein